MTTFRVRKWSLWGGLLVLLPLIAACHMVHPFSVSSTKHSLPTDEPQNQFDRNEFVHYLDSAAIDDWEGIWLLMGSRMYCYLAIERINNFNYEARYTHRIMLWFDINVADLYTYPSGLIVGYLEQDILSEVRHVLLYDISVWNHWFYWDLPVITTKAYMSEDHSTILLDKMPRRWKRSGKCGLKRIYPIRSREEMRHKVRYL